MVDRFRMHRLLPLTTCPVRTLSGTEAKHVRLHRCCELIETAVESSTSVGIWEKEAAFND
eukprot:1779326-Amphidinium_carterae.1